MTTETVEAPRIVVVQPGRPTGYPDAWLTVGVLPWLGPEPRVTIVAKCAFQYAPIGPEDDGVLVPRLAAHPAALSLGEDSTHSSAELYYPNDFVPRKGATDLLLVGHAHAPNRELRKRIDCGLVVGTWRHEFAVGWEDLSEAIPLSRSTLAGEEGDESAAIGPGRRPQEVPERHDEAFDYCAYNAASPAFRPPEVAPDETLELQGLSRNRSRLQLRLPGLVPLVAVELPRLDEPFEVDLKLDTVWFDTDQELLIMVWRGDLPTRRDGAEIRRIIASLEPQPTPETDDEGRAVRARPHWDSIWARMSRARISYAVREADLAPGAAPIPTDDEQLQSVRHELLLRAPGEPELELEQYARIGAELGEQQTPEERRTVLESYDLTEERWALEERAWLDCMSRQSMAGDIRLSLQYSEAYQKAQDELGTEQEEQRSAKDLAAVLVAMETSDPSQVMTDHDLTLPALMRLMRRTVEAAKAGQGTELRDEIDRLRKERDADRADAEPARPDEAEPSRPAS